MTAYSDVPNSELAIDAPVKSSTHQTLRDNTLSIFEGDATAIAAGKALAIDSGGQTAVKTDETDTRKVLRPDGVNTVVWGDNPGWNLVERKEIAAAVQSVSFTGLDGNTDEVYKLIARINKAANAAGTSIFSLRPNGVVTNQHMGRVINGAAIAFAADLVFYNDTTVNQEIVSLETLIHARDTVAAIALPRSFMGKVISYDNLNNIMKTVEEFGGAWDTTANMTSLDVHSTIAADIGIGSTFELFKLAQA